MTPGPTRFTIQLVIPDLMAVDFMEDTTNPELLTRDVASPTFPVENTDQTGILNSISTVKANRSKPGSAKTSLSAASAAGQKKPALW